MSTPIRTYYNKKKKNNQHNEETIKSHCRFCAQEKKITDLLDLSTEKETMECFTSILEFFKIDYINFDNNFPKTSCEPCYNMIVDCHNFFLDMRAAQVTLNELYCKKEDQDEVDLTELDPSNIKVKLEDKTERVLSDTEGTVLKNRLSPIVTNSSNQSHLHFSNTSVMHDEDDEICIQVYNVESLSNIIDNTELNNSNNMSLYISQQSDESLTSICDKKSDIESTSLNSSEQIPKISNLHVENLNKEDLDEAQKENDDKYWNGYPWRCQFCKIQCNSMNDLRLHGVQLHKRCYAFRCADCSINSQFNMFNSFIEHVRMHRQELRYYCPHCNMRFESTSECANHIVTHWSNGQRICELCGGAFPDANALKAHNKSTHRTKLHLSKVISRPHDCNNCPTECRSWDDYIWTCRECYQLFSDVQALRMHTQEMHDKCFSTKCVDCQRTPYNYNYFIMHVRQHRPYLMKYCAYCNEHIKSEKELQKHEEQHFIGPRRACDGCGQIFENKEIEIEHYTRFQPARQSKYLTKEDLTCDVCNTIFTTICALRYHKVKHDENRKKHICHICGKQLIDKRNLTCHIKSHNLTESDRHICKVCKLTFKTEYTLRAHVKSHFEDKKKFICDYCSKGFRAKETLTNHIHQHHMKVYLRTYKCQFCSKEFNAKIGLKVHINTHTGERPYQCQNCDKTFTNWGNCNKHMMRIHKTTLAKTKLTEHGRIPISRIEEVSKTVKNITPDKKEWMRRVVRADKRRRKD